MNSNINDVTMPEQGRSLLQSYARELGLEITSRQIDLFSRYLSLVLEWSSKINLTAITSPMDIVIRHFCDSISCFSVTGSLNRKRLADVGAGAGFPGIPLKILFPEMSLTLVESVNKKSRFLETAVDRLQLPDSEIVNQRAELVGQNANYRDSYDVAVARGVGNTAVLMEYLLPLVSLDGLAMAMKGDSAAAEAKQAADAASILGGGDLRIHEVGLPKIASDGSVRVNDHIRHYLVVAKKMRQTPDEYPRRVGVPAKRPIRSTKNN